MQLGIEVERVGAPDDPVEGSNVTLICTSYSLSSANLRAITLTRYPSLIIPSSIRKDKRIDPPTWFYYANGNATWHKFSKNFLKEPNAGMKHYTYYKKNNVNFDIASICKSHLSSQIFEPKLKGRQTIFTKENCT
jgi:hypothetical protein